MKRSISCLSWLVVVLWLAVWSPSRLVQAGEDLVPEDQCIVELQLPPGTTVSVDGKGYGSPPRLSFDSLERQKVYPKQFTIHFKDGGEETRTVLVNGGWRVRLALAGASKERLELVPQTGHTESIASVAFSPNGRQVLTSSDDKTAILWDAASGQQLRTFGGHTDKVTSAAISPDGKQVLTGSIDTRAILWDAASGQQLRTFRGHGGWVYSVAISPDGRQALTGSVDKTVILWDTASGQQLRTFQGHTRLVRSVAFSPDGRQVLTGSEDKTAILWDAVGGQQLRTFQGHGGWVYSVAISPDGRQVLTGSWDKTAILWDTASGQQLRTFQGHTGMVRSVAFSPDGRQVLTGSEDNAAILWDAASGQQLRTFQGHTGMVRSVAFSPDGRQVLTGSHDKTAILWDTASGQQLRTFQGHTNSVTSVVISLDGRKVLTRINDGTAIVWDADSGRQLRTFKGHTLTVGSVAVSPDGRHVLTGAGDTTAILWDAASGQQLRTFKGHTYLLESVAFSPDGRQVLAGSGDCTAILWDAASGQQLRTFKRHDGIEGALLSLVSGQQVCGHVGPVTSVAFSPDGKQVLTGSLDTTAILWDAASGQQLRTFKGHTFAVESVAISPDGRQVLTGSHDKTAILWDTASGQQLRTFRGHSDRVYSVAISPHGRQVLTGSDDNTAILWDAASGQQLRTFQGHTAWVSSVAFSPGGRAVLTASGDGTVRLWDVATGQELARLMSLDSGKDWLVVTPDGLFDGFEGGRQKVMFRVGGGLNVVLVDRFFNSFYRSGLLREVIEGERPLPEFRLGRTLPPTLKILSPKPGETESQEVTVEVEATDQGGGIAGLCLYDNDARIVATGQARLEGNMARRSFRLFLVNGENRLRAKATSGDGAWECEPVEILLRYEKPLAKSQLYLLSVGINRYADAGMNLLYAAPDARAMAAVFGERGKALYQEVHIKTLLDQEATKAGIKATLAELASQTQSQDTLIVYLAGHGTTLGERYYFLPHELRSHAQSLEEDVRTQGLPGDVLSDWIGAAKAIRRILIYDTCASGAALGLHGGRSGVALRGAVERLARAQGIFTIAACSATEEAMEREELGHGLLCYALLAGLKGVDRGPLREQWVHPSGPDQVVDVMEWFTYAANQVPRLMEKYYGTAQDVPVHMRGTSFPVLPLPE